MAGALVTGPEQGSWPLRTGPEQWQRVASVQVGQRGRVTPDLTKPDIASGSRGIGQPEIRQARGLAGHVSGQLAKRVASEPASLEIGRVAG